MSTLLLVINHSISQQFCVDSCSYNHDFDVTNMIKYYSSTGDRFDYDYVANQSITYIYIHKTCPCFQANVISFLHSDPFSSSCSCLSTNCNISLCDQSCQSII